MTNTKELDDLIARRKEIDEEIKILDAERNQIKDKILSILTANDLKSYDYENYHVVKTVSTSEVYDWDRIKRKIGALKFKSLTKTVPDKSLVAKAISAGTIRMSDISKFVETKTGDPYITITEKKK